MEIPSEGTQISEPTPACVRLGCAAVPSSSQTASGVLMHETKRPLVA